MGKPTLDIDAKRLRAALTLAEKDGPRQSHHELFQAVADLYNAGEGLRKAFAGPPPIEITWAIARHRVREWKWSVKTPLGKKGRPKGRKSSTVLPITPTATAESALRECLNVLSELAADEGWDEHHRGRKAIRTARRALGQDEGVRAGA